MQRIESRIVIEAHRSYPEDPHLLWRTLQWAVTDDRAMWRREVVQEKGTKRVKDSGWVRRGQLRGALWHFTHHWMESGFNVIKGPAYKLSDAAAGKQSA